MPLGPQNIDLKKSLAQLASGGLPTRAALRLADETGPGRKLFTSDLSVNEHLLAREAGCTPISQVMGSSIYHIGRIPDYKGKTGEIAVLSQAHREARRLAISRLALEARAVQADAVIGVRLGERLITKGSHGKGGDDGDEVIEFSVVGTAVRAPIFASPATPAGVQSPREPILTDLSGQDFWALARDGYVPTGLVFEFCRYHVWHVLAQGSWTARGEVTSATAAVDAARELVEKRVTASAAAEGAEFVVGSDLEIEVHEVPCGYPECKLNDLDVNVSWFGTGIRKLKNVARFVSPSVPPIILGMMPLGRRKRGSIVEGEEDEAAELAKQAAEDERRALEADERREKK